MEYAVVSLPAAPVRRKPRHSSEMTSQLLFGETVKIIKTRGDLWVKIRSLHDNYEGWMTNTLLEPVNKTFAETENSYVATGLLNEISIGDRIMQIPFGSSLPFFNYGRGKLGKWNYEFHGNCCKRNEQPRRAGWLTQKTSLWLNAPYMWGGRTPLGVDCSGFVQVIFKMMGIDLPRDAWQQAQEGKAIKKFSDVQAGDLIFFNNKEEIVHVGIYLGEGKMIHAAGMVRIDEINKRGFVDAAVKISGKRLRAIRRYW